MSVAAGECRWEAEARRLSAVAPRPEPARAAELRREILDLCREYALARPLRVPAPGTGKIPASSKVLDGDDLAAIVDAALDLWLTEGRWAEAFARGLAESCGLAHALLTVSGSAANLLAFAALTSPQLGRPVTPGSEVITAAAAFPTTVFPIVQNRAVPVFVDVELETANVDTAALEAALSPRTRAVVLAHTLGNPFDLRAVTEFCRRYELYLIEDCCDALGARYAGRHVGTFGELATLSFYPAHHITTGEGGAVLTGSATLARIVASFRDWGRDCWCRPGFNDTCGMRFGRRMGSLPPGYDHKFIYSHAGYNLKMTEMQAALGASQLSKLGGFVQRRKENFAALQSKLRRAGIEEHFVLPRATPGSDPSWFGFLLTIRDGSPLERRPLVEFLEGKSILTRPLFAGNLARQPVFERLERRIAGELRVTDKLMRDAFWIGVWPGLSEEHLDYMAEALREAVRVLAR